MVSIFPFRTRSRERDEETDAARFERLSALMLQMATEIDSERAGLEARYRSQTADAGFLLEALANDDVSIRSSARADALTSSILRCEQRLAALSRQAELMQELRLHLGKLVDGDGTDAAKTV